MSPPSTCRAPKGDRRTASKDPVIGFPGVIAAETADGRFDVTLANAHVVSAHPGEAAGASRPSVGARVHIEWPHDADGGWRLAG